MSVHIRGKTRRIMEEFGSAADCFDGSSNCA